MILNPIQTLVIALMVSLGTAVTRFLPFIIFRKKAAESPYLDYLAEVLPYASIGLLVVFCLKNTEIAAPRFALPEIMAIAAIIILHRLKNNYLLSIGAGTLIYMLLVQTVFI